MHLTATSPASATAPLVQLVALDGSPIESPAPTRPAALNWPAWTDLVRVRLGASDDDLERHRLSWGIGDALTRIMWRADNLGQPETADDLPPISGGSPADDDPDLAAWLEARPPVTASPVRRDLPTVERLEAVATGLYGDRPTAAD